jgi:DNA-binding MarR family transcriptional regulator
VRSIDPSVSTLIAVLARRHRALAADLIRPLGLVPGQESVLTLLTVIEPKSQAELGRELGVERPTIAKMIGRMERSGLVVRGPAAHDRRLVMVSRSHRGRTVQGELERVWERLDEVTLAEFDEGESRAALDLLGRLVRNVDGARADEVRRRSDQR